MITTTNTDPLTTLHPADILMALIVALLAPMFLAVSAGDLGLARMAAIETINAYRARNHADLIAVAQIVAFGLAALGSLSLSLQDDVSPSMALRLRGNANACNRSAERNRRALLETQTTVPDEPEPPPPDPEPFLSPAAEHLLAAEAQARLHTPEQPPAAPAPPARSHQQLWAIAMRKQAARIDAGIATLPPAERRDASIRSAMLSSTANDLLSGASIPKPGASPDPDRRHHTHP